jgi:hypothetical protein
VRSRDVVGTAFGDEQRLAIGAVKFVERALKCGRG